MKKLREKHLSQLNLIDNHCRHMNFISRARTPSSEVKGGARRHGPLQGVVDITKCAPGRTPSNTNTTLVFII